MIDAAEIARIRSEVSIVDVLEARGFRLRRVGQDFVMCCPFHDEKTGSFKVNPVKNTWYCHGACKEGGDVNCKLSALTCGKRHRMRRKTTGR